jgi:hypothetical protein
MKTAQIVTVAIAANRPKARVVLKFMGCGFRGD